MTQALLKIDNLSKFYGDIKVLSGVSLEIRQNEIVGIAGENGAGKSTTLKLLAGVIAASSGTMTLDGADYVPTDYRDAVTKGVAMVFQEQALIGNLRIFENIYYGFEDAFQRWELILDRRKMRRVAQEKLIELGFGHIDANALTDDLPFHDRQMVEIARAFILSEHSGIAHPLILLDEPTAAIGEREVAILFEAVRRLREKASFVIVTHKLSEYIDLCDRIYVLKDGEMAGELSGDQIVDTHVHELMVGRIRDEALYHEDMQRTDFGDTRLRVEHLQGPDLAEISFGIAAGEVLGIGGLIGCGKEEVVRAIVGHRPHPENGQITVMNEALPLRGRTTRVKSLGLGYVPKERKTEGIIGYMSVAQNISLPSLDLVSLAGGVISPNREKKQAEDFISKLSIKARGPGQDAVYLSGGNQQKLVLAKWLARDISVMVLDNPTRGVDVGAKSEIYAIIRDLTSRGVSVLLVSDDLLELIGLSNRILVMREGAVTAEIDAPVGTKPTEQDIVRFMT
ncbi:sugar ABC transporter ATP-binding protein [Phaeobacter sp. LSS9]|uniref:sugar ABC transporter ATP-binding protein n=1 Tax=unclassified Phaeobacter TaxID=2621772 RepID=UPI000E4773D2|nr:sugar ABC transporter ATP-binding protein [Phaeobacter sp. LSS9]AXT36254.1 sugar ABC transporter ATP-binding protein [Phaeobacter sp. LSS9]